MVSRVNAVGPYASPLKPTESSCLSEGESVGFDERRSRNDALDWGEISVCAPRGETGVNRRPKVADDPCFREPIQLVPKFGKLRSARRARYISLKSPVVSILFQAPFSMRKEWTAGPTRAGSVIPRLSLGIKSQRGLSSVSCAGS